MINLAALKENIDHEIEESKKESENTFRCTMGLAELISEALEQTLATDMVEVVRCKDCKWYGDELSEGKHSCENFQLPYCLENDFCSYGERNEK